MMVKYSQSILLTFGRLGSIAFLRVQTKFLFLNENQRRKKKQQQNTQQEQIEMKNEITLNENTSEKPNKNEKKIAKE